MDVFKMLLCVIIIMNAQQTKNNIFALTDTSVYKY